MRIRVVLENLMSHGDLGLLLMVAMEDDSWISR